MRNRSVLSGAAAGVILTVLAGQACGQQWRSGAAPAEFEPGLGALTGPGRVVVRLREPVTPAAREQLASMGLHLLAYLKDNTYFARVDADVDAKGLVHPGGVVGSAAIKTSWKVHPDLANGAPAWLPRTGDADPMVPLYVVLHRDVEAGVAGAKVVEGHAGVVQGVSAAVNMVVAHVPASRVLALAQEESVQWIEPAMAALQEMNAENRALTQADAAQASPYSLNGEGVSILVFDGGSVRASHQDFGGRVTVIDTSGMSGHATHVAGTVGGSGAASGGANRGMAPGVTLLSAGVNIAGVSGWLYTNPCDIEADYGIAWTQGADLATNSIGTNTAANGFDCEWHGNYGQCMAVIDAIVRGSVVTGGEPFRVTWAAGNERGNGRCGTGYATTAPPAGAKNHLCIGSVNSNSDAVSSFSSWGPTDDGRLKPDFSAPGCQSGGDGGVTSAYSTDDTAYASLCGTSMATPTVAGCAALMMQDFRASNPGDADPRNSTLKVLFAQSAQDRGNVGPDYQYGYGSMRVRDAIDLMRTGNWVESSVLQGIDEYYEVVVPAGQSELALTLAWDDFPGTGNVIPALVNDLDLEVYAPNGDRAWVWTLNPADPAAPAVRTGPNRLDNIEQVRVSNPAPGTWRVRVRAWDVPEGPQPFSLVSSRPIQPGVPFPSLAVLIDSAPTMVGPGISSEVRAQVIVQNDTLVPGSVVVNYRPTPGSSYSAVPMAPVSGNVWAGTLPGFSCDHEPQFYVSASAQTAGTATAPSAASPLSMEIAEIQTVWSDDLETDRGWTGGQPGDTATTGQWERADPEQTGAQPGDDHTPAPGTLCWVTGPAAGTGVGTFDIDGGATTLVSPVIDMAGQTGAELSYWRWYSNTAGAAPNADVFVVQISNNGGSTWQALETVGPAGAGTSGGWIRAAFNVDGVITPTASMRVRFIAEDAGAGSVVEAALDDIVITRRVCEDPPAGCDPDVNCDGSPDQGDVACMILAVAGDISCICQDPDFNQDGSADQGDVAALIGVVAGQPCP